MRPEEKMILRSFLFPGLMVVLMWSIHLFTQLSGISLTFLGIHPLKPEGLPGILLAPFLHADWKHLGANTIPMLVLGAALFYFYKPLAWKILALSLLVTGFWVWTGARGGVHIGASGLIYALAAFLFVSGLLRRDTRLMAVSLIVVFLYGGMVWGVFPDFLPQKNISWESHLFGGISGIMLALYYRTDGPQRRKYSWELEPEEENDESPAAESTDDDTQKPYWQVPEPDRDSLDVIYHIRKKNS
ncbi:MAG: rhomboid family intramembrane serine protease [Bacteroidetes bacterium]|nr:rhomboid family intramembrane serine protease [Bacteroidota bacterium]